tara:strand:- start:307 stop:618 length:312 start_codon:yes stop_codon:yes gene_type:complete
MFRVLLTSSLILNLLGSVLHIDLHQVDHDQGYGICDISCDEENHHSMAHQCEKCLNSNIRFIVQEKNDLSINFNASQHWFLNQNSKNHFSNYNLYSRPPPSLL